MGLNKDDNTEHDVAPRSAPTLYNFTISGGGAVAESALRFHAGTAGTLVNFLVAAGTGFSHCVDIQDDSTWNQASSGSLTMAGAIFPDVAACFMDDDTMGDLESTWWGAGQGNRTLNVSLPGAASPDEPRFVPESDSPTLSGAVAPPLGVSFFEPVSFVGAMGMEDWTEGWTAFPQS